MNVSRHAAWKRATSNVPSSRRNFIRFTLAKLQAESSRNMYSLQGLLALMRPELGHVCQRLTVVSYCTPGSPQCHAHSAIRCNMYRASCVGGSPRPFCETQRVVQRPPFSTV